MYSAVFGDSVFLTPFSILFTLSCSRLPLMAKKLEEHLYRSSHTKNEYIDPASLKRRLHLIAKGVGVPKHALGGAEDTIGLLFAGMDEDDDDNDDGLRGDASTVSNQSVMQPLPAPSHSTSAGVLGMGSNPEEATSNQGQHQQLLMSLQAQGNGNTQILMQQLRQQQQLSQQQQLQQVLGSQQQNNSRPGSTNNISSNVVLDQLQRNMSQAASSGVPDELSANLQALVGSAVRQNSNPQRVVTESNGSDARSEKKKIILQQQQRRLLLLRHASKCDGGPNCRTRFCPQMVTLWKHMKKCRDKNCKVSHCLSIRCLLNHYRICKREGLTSSCEICAPVMKHIRQQSDQNRTDLPESDPIDQMAGDQMAGLNDTHDPLDAFSPSADGESQADVQLSNVSSMEPLDAFTMLENNMNILSRMDPSNPTPNPALMQVINAMMRPALQNNGTGSIQEEITKKQALLQQVQQQKVS